MSHVIIVNRFISLYNNVNKLVLIQSPIRWNYQATGSCLVMQYSRKCVPLCMYGKWCYFLGFFINKTVWAWFLRTAHYAILCYRIALTCWKYSWLFIGCAKELLLILDVKEDLSNARNYKKTINRIKSLLVIPRLVVW